MPGMDGSGPMGQGPMTGGRRGRGGRGYRNQYHAIGLTGWQHAEMAAAPAGERLSDAAHLGRIEAKIAEAPDKLSRLEGAE